MSSGHPVELEWLTVCGRADFPEPLVDLPCRLSTHFGILCSLARWILSHPPMNEGEPMLQSQPGFAKKLISCIERLFWQVLTGELHLNIAYINTII